MHTYLESVGFKNIRSRREMDKLVSNTVLHFDEKHLFEDEDGRLMGEFSREYAPDMGVTVCGEFDERGDFHPDYYIPYLHANNISSNEEITIERHAGKVSYAGACDDARCGVTIIFYLLNMGEYRSRIHQIDPNEKLGPVRFSALARDGKVLLPVRKEEWWVKQAEKKSIEHTKLVNAARVGDEDAIESLTVEDMDLYTMIQQRIPNEDVFSIVDTTFMPYGIECDQYSIVGTINRLEKVRNIYSGESIWKMEVNASDITFDVCINESSLMGEPKEGRRLRANVLLEGEICFT